MVVAQNRPTRLLISKAAVAHNLAETRKAAHAKTVFLAVKANAYGFGLLEVSKAAIDGGADGLAVAVIDEALALREAGFTCPILIMSLIQPEYAGIAAANNFITTVASIDWLGQAAKYINGDVPLRVSVAVDTGMGRIGYRDRAEIDASLNYMEDNASLFTYYGLMTHFSQADSEKVDYFHKQLARWHELTDTLPKPPMIHVPTLGRRCTTRTKSRMTSFAPGPSCTASNPPSASCARMTTCSRLNGSKPNWSSLSKCTKRRYLVRPHLPRPRRRMDWHRALGYGDGLMRKLTGFHVLVNGQECPIVGKLAMDAMMIKLPGNLPVGTKVTVLGTDGDKTIRLDDWADYIGIAPWELSIIFQDRLKRELVERF